MNISLTSKNLEALKAIRADLKRHMDAQPVNGKAAERVIHNTLLNADRILAEIEKRGNVPGPEDLGGPAINMPPARVDEYRPSFDPLGRKDK
jgi:hypothetical protein